MNNQLIKLITKSLNMKILAILVPLFFISCNNNEIAIDAEKFCSCRRVNLETPEKCNDILEKLNIKYQFDSEGADELQDAIYKCLPL